MKVLPNKQLLTDKQIKFLEVINNTPSINLVFKFSGGTALTTFYTPYRYSDDLDFFSEEIFEPTDITNFIASLKKQLGFAEYTYSSSFNRNLYFLKFKNNYELKTEFTYYPFASIKQPLKFENLSIDSSYDLAVNKLFTIYQNPALRHFMDLYMIVKTYEYDFEEIKKDAQVKFGTYIEPIQLGSQLLKVKSLEDAPKLIQLLEGNWKEYFLDKAKSLESAILV